MKMKTQFPSLFKSTFLIEVFTLVFILPASAATWYVRSNAAGTNDGSSWTNAFTKLQDAIDASSSDDEIWVAGGTYLPTFVFGGASVRNRTFYIDKEIHIFGGFAGTAGTEGDFSSRDLPDNPTVLSGNIGATGDNTDNVFHILYIDHVGNDLFIDGFIIKDGYAKDGTPLEGSGAAVFNDGTNGTSSPRFINCHFDNNHADESGGAVVNWASDGNCSSFYDNCTFTNNSASGGGAIANVANPNGTININFVRCAFKGNAGPTAGGGAIQNIAVTNSECSSIFANCLFSGNFSPNSGAVHTFANDGGSASPRFFNCTFAGNSSTAISTSNIGTGLCEPVLANCIVWNNGAGTGIIDNGSTTTATFSIIPFGFPGTGNFGSDPLFVSLPDFNDAPTTAGDLHLLNGSPAIDAGDNDALPGNITTDLEGNPRYINPNTGTSGTIDMGAYELQGITATTDPENKPDWEIYPNPASEDITLVFGQPLENVVVRIFDLKGSLQIEKALPMQASFGHIDIEMLTSGVYMVQVVAEKGSSMKCWVKL
jgi:hypothetical protein